jgi:hypothetical protein
MLFPPIRRASLPGQRGCIFRHCQRFSGELQLRYTGDSFWSQSDIDLRSPIPHVHFKPSIGVSTNFPNQLTFGLLSRQVIPGTPLAITRTKSSALFELFILAVLCQVDNGIVHDLRTCQRPCTRFPVVYQELDFALAYLLDCLNRRGILFESPGADNASKQDGWLDRHVLRKHRQHHSPVHLCQSAICV